MSEVPQGIPQVQDKRPRAPGLLPRNAQGLVLGAIALVMVLIILFSGRTAPKAKPPSSVPVNESALEPNPARIRDYRARIEEETRKLAAEEAQLAQTKAALGVQPVEAVRTPGGYTPSPYSSGIPGPEAERDSIELARRKREYQSLFASNIALTYRRDPITPADPVAPGATAGRKGTSDGDMTDRAATACPAASATAREPAAGASIEPSHPYRLFEGTALETVLTNRLDSSFSGPVNCMVTTNVYSHDGQRLLIPQGSRVLGEVRKLDSYGEQRLAVSFHRLIMPDGFSVSLDQFKGLDQIGQTGLRDQVNHHYLQVFGVSIAIGALAGLSQANTRYSLDVSAAQAYQQGVAASLSQSALHILDHYLNVLPTFTIREGFRIKVYLSQDLMLPAYDQHPVRGDL